MDPKSSLITRRSLADAIGVTPRRMMRWVKEGTFPIGRNGKRPLSRINVLAVINKTVHTSGVKDLPTIPERFYQRKELAAKLNVSVASVMRWTQEGCPCFWFSLKSVRYLPDEVEAWLATNGVR